MQEHSGSVCAGTRQGSLLLGNKNLLVAFFFARWRRKEKAIKKETPNAGGVAPPPASF